MVDRLPHADVPGLTPENCPNRGYHGKPFLFCPVKGCGWQEGYEYAYDPDNPPACIGVTCYPDRHQVQCCWGLPDHDHDIPIDAEVARYADDATSTQDLTPRQRTERAFQERQEAYKVLQEAQEAYNLAVRVHEAAWYAEPGH